MQEREKEKQFEHNDDNDDNDDDNDDNDDNDISSNNDNDDSNWIKSSRARLQIKAKANWKTKESLFSLSLSLEGQIRK